MARRWLADRASQLCFLYAALVGFLLWALSPKLLGQAEPWDTPYPVYSATMLVGGLVLGLVARHGRALIAGYLGAWLGQVLALVLLPISDRGWLILGIASTAVGSVSFLVGTALGTIFHRATKGKSAI